MLRYYYNRSANFSLQERMYQVATNRMVRGMIVLNIVLLLLIPILDMILLDMSHKICFLLLLCVALLAYVFVIVWISGHWNEQLQRTQLSPIINVLILVLILSCSWAFYQHMYSGVGWWGAYIFPICIAMTTIVIAIITRMIEHRYR